MRILYYGDDVTNLIEHRGPAIFLAGPTSRGPGRTEWRLRALDHLDAKLFKGAVVVPEFREGWSSERAAVAFDDGHLSEIEGLTRIQEKVLQWETGGIEGVDTVLFWMAFSAELPGLTTRSEVTREIFAAGRRAILGMPPTTRAVSFIRYHASRKFIPIHGTLEAAVAAAVRHAERNAPRI